MPAAINVIPGACPEEGQADGIEELNRDMNEGMGEAEAGGGDQIAVSSLLEQQVDGSGRDLRTVSFTDSIKVKSKSEQESLQQRLQREQRQNASNLDDGLDGSLVRKDKKKQESAEDKDRGAQGDWDNEEMQFANSDGANYAQMQGLHFDPDKPYEAPEEKVISPQEKEALVKVVREKEAALHDCLSITSCQLLRKDVEQIRGRKRKWYTLGLWAHSHRTDLLEKIVQRCLSHSELVGPNFYSNCETCPDGLLWGCKGKFGGR